MAKFERSSVLWCAGAVACFALFALVGLAVSARAPGPFDAGEGGAYGSATALAKLLTSSGRFPAYAVLCAASLVFAMLRREWLARVLVAIVGLIVVWRTSDVAKLLFQRARPPHPIVPETSFGYPSGHADLALFFYGLWAYFIWQSDLDRSTRVMLVAFATLWVVAIGWSRLALGAHYPTDVLGGYLYGAGWLALTIAFVARFRFARRTASRGSARFR